jgi:hypothetical protein
MAAKGTKRRGWWALASLVPLGLGTWAGFAYAGSQTGTRRWQIYAALYALAAAGALAYSSATHVDGGDNSTAGMFIVLPWAFGIGHSFVARPAYVRKLNRRPDKIEKARERLAERDKALRIAREDPRLALELGIGRPDRKGAMDAGLVDVNGAPGWALEHLPGVDGVLAERILQAREQLDGFASLEDLGMTLDLPGDVVEDMRGKAVFLPR